ncbi:MAG TPA: 4Fe-4S dicluster domain-containing protein, partial [Thermoleophilia bacterium]|nr:4Fe-4S dicluster domain-containing protein [Thermoleophilia bacterium]
MYETVFKLADECRQCYQCGQCIGACPSGFDLDQGPRRIVRLILAGEVDRLLEADDVWRCSECRACSDICPMEVDTAAMMAAVRDLQREHGGARCPERAAADIAHKRLSGAERIDNMQFGVAMATKGFVPKDVVGAAEAGLKIAKQMIKRGEKAGPGGAPSPDARPFYAGCSLPQDRQAWAATHKVARDLGVRLAEATEAGCCGHPSRGKTPAKYASDAPVLTACPACDAGLREAELQTQPLWNALTEHAERTGRTLTAAGERFVPYVGCLSERGPALSSLSAAAALADARIELTYPSLHAGCCGALGGMYRGESEAVKKLIAFAQSKDA